MSKKDKTRAEIADEIEFWSTAYGGKPDVLSMAETVADYWREIVAAEGIK